MRAVKAKAKQLSPGVISMTEQYSSLFQPIKIGKLELKNRLSVPPMGTGFAEDGHVSDRLLKYLEERSKGGFGLIITEFTAIDSETGFGTPNQLCLYDDKFIPSFKKLADAVHKYGARLAVQLFHPGRSTLPRYNGGRQPVAPSEVADPVMRQVPHALTIEEIHALVEKFAQGARRAKEAGLDAVELHGAHGYLIPQFLSAYANRRTDDYGESLEGFLRFPLEIIKRARELVGPDFPLLFRISADEMVPQGRNVPKSIEMAKRLAAAGIDAMDISVGVLETGHLITATCDLPEGFNAATSAEFKAALDVPVLVTGRINHPQTAEDIIKQGKADIVHIGRQSLSDPAWPNKAGEGREDDIVNCLSCNEGCLEGLSVWLRPSINCVQNPALGREEEYAQPPVAKAKKVLIAGGGPAGLEAARTAALRGHKVIIFEKDGYLGGQVRLAAMPPSKDIYQEVAKSRIKAIRDLGVDIRMGQRLTAGMVGEIKPEVLIIATGSEPAIPNIPGVNSHSVMSARKALTSDEVGDNVLVIGGGMAGCETADYLAGKEKSVTIVEMLKRTAGDIGPAARYFLNRRLKEKQVNIITRATVKSISAAGVTIEAEGNKQQIGPFDTIVLATGSTPVNTLQEQVRDIVPAVYVTGDACKPGKILAAVESAAEIALKI